MRHRRLKGQYLFIQWLINSNYSIDGTNILSNNKIPTIILFICTLTLLVRGPSEFDVYRRQVLTYKDGPRTERIETLVMVVNP